MHATLQRLARRLPPPLARHATDQRLRTLVQFTQFGTVGLAGLVVDTATVYALRGPLGLYGAGLAAYATAATTTWLLNRIWTFRGQGSGPAHHQWARFVAANLVGFVLNRGAYVLCVAFIPLAARQPVIATSAGAIAGMFVNFSLSRRLVFR
ncbi:MAG: GtrA family protein [Rhodospirillales bacterium]|nr:GtrA family protein [Rhodospirillales bacterium]MBN8905576.1 GtrA family protein [Rhodospirillales bacterium]